MPELFNNFCYCCLEREHLCYFRYLTNSLIYLRVGQETYNPQNFRTLTYLFLSRTLYLMFSISWVHFIFWLHFPNSPLKQGFFFAPLSRLNTFFALAPNASCSREQPCPSLIQILLSLQTLLASWSYSDLPPSSCLLALMVFSSWYTIYLKK